MKYILYTDGGSRGNPGPAACAAVVIGETGEVVAIDGKYLGSTTNNVAEYQGLLVGLKLINKLKPAEVEIRMDSELIVKQLLGEYRVKDENMQKQFSEVKTQLEKLTWRIVHVPRSQNAIADKLVNLQMDAALELH